MTLCVNCLYIIVIVFVILNANRSWGWTEDSVSNYGNDSTAHQLSAFAARVRKPIGILTTSFGSPVTLSDMQTTNTQRLILNEFFMESMSHLTSERIPERVVHAKGSGAFGYFKVTHDLFDICKAKLFSKVNKTTPVAVRFSTVVQRIGGRDTSREPRGFAIKFYTEEGNYDFVGLDVECFVLKNPVLFNSFVHSFHRNPTTMVDDHTARWDFLTRQPESLNMYMRIFGDLGIPNGYRYMPASAIHTFELKNIQGKKVYARFHLLPDLGIRNLTTAQAHRIIDLDYATRDLYNAIAVGNFPTWTLYVQTIPEHEIRKANFDIFDITKIWPEKLYPIRQIGTLVLNKNPENHFAEIEQLAFNPGNLVPGIRGIDSVFEARVLAYRLGHVHRLGVNFNKIPVNCPFKTVPRTYNRDGSPPVWDNERDSPNYHTNSFNGPVPAMNYEEPRISVSIDPLANNFDQASDYYVEMPEGEKYRLVQNIIASLCKAEKILHKLAVSLYKQINKDLGNRVEYGIQNCQNASNAAEFIKKYLF